MPAEMTENKQFAIALAAPTLLLALSMGAWAVPSEVDESEAVSVETANADFESQLEVAAEAPRESIPQPSVSDTEPDGELDIADETEGSASSTEALDLPDIPSTAGGISPVDPPRENESNALLVESDQGGDDHEVDVTVASAETSGSEIAQIGFTEALGVIDGPADDAPLADVEEEPTLITDGEPAHPPEAPEVVVADVILAATSDLIETTAGPPVPPAPNLQTESSPLEFAKADTPLEENLADQLESPDLDLVDVAVPDISPIAETDASADSLLAAGTEEAPQPESVSVAISEPSKRAQPEAKQPAEAQKISEVQSETPTIVAAAPAKPFLGIGIRDPSNAIVTTLYPDSTASKLGVILGDQIQAINAVRVSDIETVRNAVTRIAVGEKTELSIKRDGKSMKLGPLPMGSK